MTNWDIWKKWTILTITAFVYCVRRASCFRVYRRIPRILDVSIILRYGLRRSRIIVYKCATYSKSRKYKTFIIQISQLNSNSYLFTTLNFMHNIDLPSCTRSFGASPFIWAFRWCETCSISVGPPKICNISSKNRRCTG